MTPKPRYEDELVTLYQGDCTELLPQVVPDDKLAVALVTDPPYGISYSSNQVGRFRDVGIDGDGDTALMEWAIAWARSHGDAPAYVFGSWKVPPPEGTRGLLIWDKGMASGMGDLSLPWKPNHEFIYVLGQGHEGHRGDSVLKGHHVVTWAHTRKHPNEKPVTLMGELIKKIPEPYLIVDPFSGSGATLMAAKKLGRRAIGFELKDLYIKESIDQLAQEQLFTIAEGPGLGPRGVPISVEMEDARRGDGVLRGREVEA